MRSNDSKQHLAEETLIRFAKIHINLNTCFKESAERILLITSTKSLFAADVCYHRKQCYIPFRGSFWLQSSSSTLPSKSCELEDPFDELCNLIEYHIINRKEIYKLSSLRTAYNEINKEEYFPNLRNIDIKERLLNKYQDLNFCIPSHHTKRTLEEYVMPIGMTLTADCIASMKSGEGITESVLVRNTARTIHRKIRETSKKRKWPPTPKDLMQNDETLFNSDLYNLLAWIVDPRAPLGEEGLVKLSKK